MLRAVAKAFTNHPFDYLSSCIVKYLEGSSTELPVLQMYHFSHRESKDSKNSRPSPNKALSNYRMNYWIADYSKSEDQKGFRRRTQAS